MENQRIIQVEDKVPFNLLVPLSIQHMFAMFGASILVPFIFGINPAVVLFMNGVGTLLFIGVTKGKAPAYLGSSFAFLAPAGVVISNFGYEYALGGFVAVGFCGCILAFIVYKFGTEWIEVVLPPAAMGPVVALIGLELSGSAASNAGLLDEVLDPRKTIVFVLTLGTAVFGSILFRKFFSVIPILIAVIVGYASALAAGIVDFAEVAAAPVFALPNFSTPKFNLEAIMIILPVLLVITSEHIGHQVVTSKIVGRDLLKDPGLHRSLFGDNFSTMISGLIGSVPTTTYGENIGVMAITRVYSVRVIAGSGRAVHCVLLYRQVLHSYQHHTRSCYRRYFLPALRYDWYLRSAYSGGFQGGLRKFQKSGPYLSHICHGSVGNCREVWKCAAYRYGAGLRGRHDFKSGILCSGLL